MSMRILLRSCRQGVASLIFVAAVVFCVFSWPIPTAAQALSSYVTNFPVTENPLSEQGRWINGGTVGLDWSNLQTTKTLAWGTQVVEGHHNDSIALMAGTWEPDLTVQAVVRTETPSFTDKLELILRGTLRAHSANLYQFTCAAGYTEIVRWNGALDNLTVLDHNPSAHCKDGDTFRASAIGSTLTSYINGVRINHATDTEYSSGSPGIGFSIDNPGANREIGFSSFAVTGGPGNSGPAPRPPGILTSVPR